MKIRKLVAELKVRVELLLAIKAGTPRQASSHRIAKLKLGVGLKAIYSAFGSNKW